MSGDKVARINIRTGRYAFHDKGTPVPESHPKYSEWDKRGLLVDSSEIKSKKAKGKTFEGLPFDLETPVNELKFINDDQAQSLADSEIIKLNDVGDFDIDSLLSINGIGKVTAGNLIEAHTMASKEG